MAERNHEKPKTPRARRSPLLFALVLTAILGAYALDNRGVFSPTEALPTFATIPAFSLTDQRNQTLTHEDLRGGIWIANFIFTRCPTVCPAFTAKMQQLRRRTDEAGIKTRSVSFSVDPDYDTPAVLNDYATRFEADADTWSFLTGSLDDIKRTVSDGLKIAMGGHQPDGNFAGIFHGSHFVLVDAANTIRGYYDANDAEAMDKLLSDTAALADEAL